MLPPIAQLHAVCVTWALRIQQLLTVEAHRVGVEGGGVGG